MVLVGHSTAGLILIADVDAFTPNNLTQVISLTSSHSPFFSQPEKLADALIASLQNG